MLSKNQYTIIPSVHTIVWWKIVLLLIRILFFFVLAIFSYLFIFLCLTLWSGPQHMAPQRLFPVTIFVLKVKCSSCWIGTRNLYNSIVNAIDLYNHLDLCSSSYWCVGKELNPETTYLPVSCVFLVIKMILLRCSSVNTTYLDIKSEADDIWNPPG
jgi:hypothetical protein